MAKSSKRRPNNTGSISRLAGGKHRGYVTVGARADGSPIRRYHTAQTPKQVQAWIDEQLHRRRQGLVLPSTDQTVRAYLTSWLEDTARPSVAVTTYASYEGVVRVHILPYIGPLPLESLTAQHVQSLMRSLAKEGVSPHRQRYTRTILGIALDQAVRWGILLRNAARLTDPPRVKRSQIHPYSPEEARALLRGVQGHRLEGVLTLAVLLGLRRGELLALRWRDIDFEQGNLSITGTLQRLKAQEGGITRMEPKSKASYRTIRMPSAVRAALQEQRKRQLAERMEYGCDSDGIGWNRMEGYVFTASNGNPYEPRNLPRDYKRLCKRLDLPIRRFHDLRHTAASLMIAQGLNIKLISEILGHASIKITLDTYSHLFDDMRQEGADRIDAWISAG